MFDNKWNSNLMLDFSPRMKEYLSRTAIIYWHVTNPEIGKPEVALIINDTDEYITKFGNIKKIILEIRPGFEKTSYGPVMYYLFAVIDKEKNIIEYIFDKPINIFNQEEVDAFYEMALQKYIHLFFIGPNFEEINMYEIENVYELSIGLDLIVNRGRKYGMIDFEKAVNEFYEKFTTDELYRKKKDGFDIIAI